MAVATEPAAVMSVDPSVDAPSHSPERLVRNIGLLGIGQLATWALTLAWTLVVPRLLGPTGVSLIVMAWFASGIMVGIAGLGSRVWLVKEIAGDRTRAAHLLSVSLTLRLLLLLPCTGVTALYIAIGGFHGAQVVVLSLSVGLTAFLLITEVMQAGLQAVEHMGYLASSDVLNKGGLTVGGIPLALAGFGAAWLVGLQVLITAAVTGLNVRWARRFHVDLRLTLHGASSFLRESLPYWAYMGFGTFYLWVDSAMLAVMAPPAVVGWYGVPTRIFQTTIFLPAILSTAWLPRLSAAFVRSPGDLEATARAPFRVITVSSLPIAVGLALVAGPLVEHLYGAAFAPSIPILQILAITLIPMFVNIAVGNVLVASNRQIIWTWVMVAAASFNPAVNFFLIRFFQHHDGNGAIGAAWTLLLTEGLMSLYGIWLIRRIVVPELARLGRALLATLAMAVAVYVVRRYGIVVQIASGGIAFAVAAYFLRVASSEELAEIADKLPGARAAERIVATMQAKISVRLAPRDARSSAIPSLNGIRAVAVAMVFAAHVGLPVGTLGPFGVTLFFFLSGYLITTLLRIEFSRRGTISLRAFYGRRALRLFPPLYIVLALASTATLLGAFAGQSLRLPSVLQQVFYLTNYQVLQTGWVGGGRAPGTADLWSLAVEEHFYLLFPLLYLFLSRKLPSARRQIMVIGGLCLAVLAWRCVLIYGLHSSFDRTYAATDTRIDSILFGCMLAIAGNPVLDRNTWTVGRERILRLVLLPLGIVALLVTFTVGAPGFTGTFQYTVQGLALVPLFVVAVRFPTWGVMRVLNLRVVAFIGVLSYSIYLVHSTIIYAVHERLSAPHLVKGGVSLALTLLAALIIYAVIEKPTSALRKRLSRATVRPEMATDVAPAAAAWAPQPWHTGGDDSPDRSLGAPWVQPAEPSAAPAAGGL